MLSDFVQANLLLCTLVLVSGGLFIWSLFQQAGKELEPSEATLLMNRSAKSAVLDVRDPHEFAGGHLPDAINIPLSQLSERMTELESWKEFPLLVYCASGGRSARACAHLNKHGFEKLHNLAGGVSAWQKAGLPIRKPGKGRHQ